MMSKRRLTKLFAILFAFAMIAAACGGADEVADVAGDAVDAVTGDDSEEAMDDEETAVEAGDVADGDVDTEVEAVSGPRQQGGELIIGLEAEAVGMRPWEDTCASACYNMFINVFDKLMEQRADGTYSPFLLESIGSNEDFTVWTGVLRDGVTFHNGVALTAQSIEDSWPCLLYTSPSPRDATLSRMPSSA